MARITVYRGGEIEDRVELGDLATIGRASSNTIHLDESNVSRQHARIERRGERHAITNLGARNGLFLNGREIDTADLAHGDEIKVGALVLRYESDPPEPAPKVAISDSGVHPSVVFSDEQDAPDDGIVTADYSTLLDAGAIAVAPDELSAAHRRLAAVHEVAMALTSILDLTALRDRIAEVALLKLSAQRCAILTVDPGTGELVPVVAKSLRSRKSGRRDEISIPRKILARVHGSSQSIMSNDVRRDERFEGSRSLEMSKIASVLACPLERPGKKLGVIYVDTLDQTRLFEDADLRLLTTIAAVAAIAIDNAVAYTTTRAENTSLRAALRSNLDIVGESPAISRVLEGVAKVAPTEVTVLVRGETGTGKELVARAIHDASPRRDGPFIAVNCAALSESLLSSELFGHEKGSFTGAHERKQGKFEVANGGTLFLDEVGEVSPAMQAKLLRVLQERTFERVGGVDPIAVDVRIVAATNRDLEEAVKEQTFRQDLYYRLRVFEVELPPLRERKGDLPLLAGHFLDKTARRAGKRIRGYTPEAMTTLSGYPWPGNIRELSNVVERAVVMADGDLIRLEDLPTELRENKLFAEIGTKIDAFDLSLPEIIQWVEKTTIERALLRTTKKVELAKLLNISRPTLDKKIKEYGIEL